MVNCTPTTPMLSDAVAEIVAVPDTVARSTGDTIPTVGGVVSVLLTVTEALDSAVFPAASRATAPTVWGPLGAVPVFHAMVYGDEATSAPSAEPSSVNC